MDKKIDIIYTEAAKKRLDELKDRYVAELEEIIKKRKYIPGEKIVEITASDVEQASKYIRFIMPKRYESMKFLFGLYSIAGLFMTIFGLFYPELLDILRHSPERIILASGGLAVSIVGLLGYFKIKHKELMLKELELRDIDELDNIKKILIRKLEEGQIELTKELTKRSP